MNKFKFLIPLALLLIFVSSPSLVNAIETTTTITEYYTQSLSTSTYFYTTSSETLFSTSTCESSLTTTTTLSLSCSITSTTSTVNSVTTSSINTSISYLQLNYPYDDEADPTEDLSGNNYDGDITTVAYSAGVHGSAADFTAGQSWIDAGSAANTFHATDLTIAGWFKFTNHDTAQEIITRWTWSTGDYRSWLLQNAGNGKIRLGASSNGLDSGYWYGATANDFIPDNDWHFLAVTYDGTTMKFYIDDAASVDVTVSNTFYNNAGTHLSIGCQDVPYLGDSFGGSMDDTMIFTEHLTATQLLAIYNDTPSGNENHNIVLSTPTISTLSYCSTISSSTTTTTSSCFTTSVNITITESSTTYDISSVTSTAVYDTSTTTIITNTSTTSSTTSTVITSTLSTLISTISNTCFTYTSSTTSIQTDFAANPIYYPFTAPTTVTPNVPWWTNTLTCVTWSQTVEGVTTYTASQSWEKISLLGYTLTSITYTGTTDIVFGIDTVTFDQVGAKTTTTVTSCSLYATTISSTYCTTVCESTTESSTYSSTYSTTTSDTTCLTNSYTDTTCETTCSTYSSTSSTTFCETSVYSSTSSTTSVTTSYTSTCSTSTTENSTTTTVTGGQTMSKVATTISMSIGATNTGVLSQVWTVDNAVWSVAEGNGVAPVLEAYVYFNNIPSFYNMHIGIYGQYYGSAGHLLVLQYYDWEEAEWETLRRIDSNTVGKQWYNVTYYEDHDNMLDANGNAQFRFSHPTNGITSHYLLVDLFVLEFNILAASTTTTCETTCNTSTYSSTYSTTFCSSSTYSSTSSTTTCDTTVRSSTSSTTTCDTSVYSSTFSTTFCVSSTDYSTSSTTTCDTSVYSSTESTTFCVTTTNSSTYCTTTCETSINSSTSSTTTCDTNTNYLSSTFTTAVTCTTQEGTSSTTTAIYTATILNTFTSTSTVICATKCTTTTYIGLPQQGEQFPIMVILAAIVLVVVLILVGLKRRK